MTWEIGLVIFIAALYLIPKVVNHFTYGPKKRYKFHIDPDAAKKRRFFNKR